MYRIALLLSVTALASGCATVTRGTTQAWTVESEPIGADVTLSSGEQCKTPCTLKKKRKDGFTVKVQKEGFEQVDSAVVSQVSGAGAAGMAGNVIVGGIIGIGVDAATGAAKELKPNPLTVKLVPAGQPAPAVEPAPAAAPAAARASGESRSN